MEQNSSASPSQLTSIKVQLSSENLELGNSYSVNVSGTTKTPSVNRISDGTVKFDVTDNLLTNGYMEIKFQGIVPATSDPLSLLQVAFTMNATASGSVTYGPKYSTELYTTYPEITFARNPQGGKNKLMLLYF